MYTTILVSIFLEFFALKTSNFHEMFFATHQKKYAKAKGGLPCFIEIEFILYSFAEFQDAFYCFKKFQ